MGFLRRFVLQGLLNSLIHAHVYIHFPLLINWQVCRQRCPRTAMEVIPALVTLCGFLAMTRPMRALELTHTRTCIHVHDSFSKNLCWKKAHIHTHTLSLSPPPPPPTPPHVNLQELKHEGSCVSYGRARAQNTHTHTHTHTRARGGGMRATHSRKHKHEIHTLRLQCTHTRSFIHTHTRAHKQIHTYLDTNARTYMHTYLGWEREREREVTK